MRTERDGFALEPQLQAVEHSGEVAPEVKVIVHRYERVAQGLEEAATVVASPAPVPPLV